MNATEHIEPDLTRELGEIGNTQRLYRFDNGYGASVVQGPYTYGGKQGLSEMAVLRVTGDGWTDKDWEIDYSTPITDDVIGWLDEDDVQQKLAEVRALPSPEVTA
jgi:hypothetical protein